MTADITVNELKQRLDAGEKLNIIDVREPHEYAAYNIGAKLIPLGELGVRSGELEDFRNQELIVHCRSGARSANAKLLLEDLGFSNVRNLLGGMMAWQDLNNE